MLAENVTQQHYI